MGSAAGRLFDDLPDGPVPKPPLQSLQGWSREDLKILFTRFKTTGSLTINLANFWRILKFESREEAEQAWNCLEHKPGAERIDFLSVVGPMVVMSDQRFISRMSFLFSVYDFNGSGSVNKAEFFIAVRTIFRGLSRFLNGAVSPSNSELERLSLEIFDKIDEDRTDLLELGEVLSFAYRAKGVRMLLSPFTSEDERLFEDQIFFATSSQGLTRIAEKVEDEMAKKVKAKLRTSPGAADSGRRGHKGLRKRKPRAWHQNSTVSKAHAFVLWKIFNSLANESKVIPLDRFRKWHADKANLGKKILALSGAQGGPSRKQLDEEEIDDGQASKVSMYFGSQMAEEEFSGRFEEDLELRHGISLRALMCLVLPFVAEAEVEVCMKLCNTFTAKEVLGEICEGGSSLDHVDLEDIDALFECIDADGDGQLSLVELCEMGGLSKEQARGIMDKWDRDRSGKLDPGETKAIIFQMHNVLRSQFKGAFAKALV